jgi:hypothetical protein
MPQALALQTLEEDGLQWSDIGQKQLLQFKEIKGYFIKIPLNFHMKLIFS